MSGDHDINIEQTRLPDKRRLLGRSGEQAGADWLQARGLRILERNYRCRIGEIDIIGEAEGSLVFVEVRGRSSDDRGTPAESVGYQKRQKLRNVASWYMTQKGKSDCPCRFDVLGLRYGKDGRICDFHWYRAAF